MTQLISCDHCAKTTSDGTKWLKVMIQQHPKFWVPLERPTSDRMEVDICSPKCAAEWFAHWQAALDEHARQWADDHPEIEALRQAHVKRFGPIHDTE